MLFLKPLLPIDGLFTAVHSVTCLYWILTGFTVTYSESFRGRGCFLKSLLVCITYLKPVDYHIKTHLTSADHLQKKNILRNCDISFFHTQKSRDVIFNSSIHWNNSQFAKYKRENNLQRLLLYRINISTWFFLHSELLSFLSETKQFCTCVFLGCMT